MLNLSDHTSQGRVNMNEGADQFFVIHIDGPPPL